MCDDYSDEAIVSKATMWRAPIGGDSISLHWRNLRAWLYCTGTRAARGGMMARGVAVELCKRCVGPAHAADRGVWHLLRTLLEKRLVPVCALDVSGGMRCYGREIWAGLINFAQGGSWEGMRATWCR